MKKLLSAVCLTSMLLSFIPIQSSLAAEEMINAKPTVIPSLREWTGNTGKYTLSAASRIVIAAAHSNALNETAEVFQADLKEITGRDVSITVSDSPAAGDFFLKLNTTSDTSIGEEGYFFEVGDYVTIRANTVTGAFYGTRTALQILKQDPAKSTISKGTAKDWPKYGERGFMLDVGRKFFTMDFLKEYVKFMSYYKMNDFHLHLNDNDLFNDTSRANWNKYSAFRLESTRYPELTAKDGHYTKQEFRELQDLANARGLTITPEFDTPSHALAFTKVRPDLVKSTLPVDHLDITRQEAIDFVKDVWNEYLEGDWFDAEEIHFGADEFDRNDKSTYEFYRQYLNTLNDLFKSKGKKSRAWGSLTQFPGTTPVSKDITINAWNIGWQNPIDAVNQGFKIINTDDSLLYIVPKAGYYRDYLDSKWLFENWEPTRFGGSVRVQEGNPNLLGGMFAVWNDMLGRKVSSEEVHDRVRQAMPVLAEKMWRGASTDSTYAQFQQQMNAIGEAPGTNLLHKIESQSDVIVHYTFDEGSGQTSADSSGNSYDGALNGVEWTNEGKSGKGVVFDSPTDHIITGFNNKGFPWTVSAWVKLDNNSQSEAILTESPHGAIKLKQKDTGKAGFTREGFDFSFNTEIPTGRWVHVAFKGNLQGTSLYIDGEFRSKLNDATLLPAATIGSKSHSMLGALDNVKIVDRMLFDQEIAAEAGSPPWTVNMALNKPATASSVEVSQFPASLAFDGNDSGTSRWSSGYTDNEWIYVDLGQSTDVSKVILKWQGAYATGYKIQVSNDAQAWHDVYSTTVGAGGAEVIQFPTEQARYVRMLGTKRATTYGFSLFEFEVYPPNPDNPVPVPVPVRYTEDFEDNALGGWQLATSTAGTMQLAADPSGASQYAVKLTANNVSNVFVDQSSPLIKDGEIEFKVTPQTDTIRTGIIFRYSGGDSWASVGFDQGSWYWVNAQDNYGLMTADTAARLRKGVTSTVKVKFAGKHVTLLVDGKPYFAGVLNSLPSTEGKMGARVFGPTVAVFDDFKYGNNVPEVAASGVQVNKPSITLNVGEAAEITATVKPGNATNRQVAWSSNNEAVAKVETVNGKTMITGLQAGTADITVTTVDGGHTAVSRVTVEPAGTVTPASSLTGASSVRAGSEFTVNFGLSNVAEQVYAQDITLDYDADIMEFVSADSLITGVSVVETKAEAGKIRLIVASQGAGHAVSGNAEVVKLTFRAKPLTSPASGTITVANATLADGAGSEAAITSSSISIEVTTAPPGIPGDTNGDGKVSIGDLAIVAAHYGKTSSSPDWEQAKRADVDGDGDVDLDDLVKVASRIVDRQE